MERKMESRDATRGGTAPQDEIGYAIQSFSTSEQLHTRSCARCAGLLVKDWCADLANTGEQNAEVLRCVQCGNHVDLVIMQNRIRALVAKNYVRQMQPSPLASMGLPTSAT